MLYSEWTEGVRYSVWRPFYFLRTDVRLRLCACLQSNIGDLAPGQFFFNWTVGNVSLVLVTCPFPAVKVSVLKRIVFEVLCMILRTHHFLSHFLTSPHHNPDGIFCTGGHGLFFCQTILSLNFNFVRAVNKVFPKIFTLHQFDVSDLNPPQAVFNTLSLTSDDFYVRDTLFSALVCLFNTSLVRRLEAKLNNLKKIAHVKM